RRAAAASMSAKPGSSATFSAIELGKEDLHRFQDLRLFEAGRVAEPLDLEPGQAGVTLGHNLKGLGAQESRAAAAYRQGRDAEEATPQRPQVGQGSPPLHRLDDARVPIDVEHSVFAQPIGILGEASPGRFLRSEERRVGKECRSRRSRDHLKRKRYATDS